MHTALTDKCFLNLMQAMHFGFGGNPFGPAGTGKVSDTLHEIPEHSIMFVLNYENMFKLIYGKSKLSNMNHLTKAFAFMNLYSDRDSEGVGCSSWTSSFSFQLR